MTYRQKFLVCCTMGLVTGLILGGIYVLFSAHPL